MPTLAQDRREMLTAKEWILFIAGYTGGAASVFYLMGRRKGRRRR